MNRRLLAGAICWICMLEYHVAEFVARAGWPGYIVSQYDISSLGATSCGTFIDPMSKVATFVCSPRHAVMNVGFIVGGLLTIAGAILTRAAWPQRASATIGLICIAIAGAGESLVGIFPKNTNFPAHVAGALLHWIFAGAGFILLGKAVRPAHPIYGIFTYVCGATILAAFVLYGSGVFLGLGRGGMERILSYPSSVWLIASGIALLVAAPLAS